MQDIASLVAYVLSGLLIVMYAWGRSSALAVTDLAVAVAAAALSVADLAQCRSSALRASP
jgi:hypothetical protein